MPISIAQLFLGHFTIARTEHAQQFARPAGRGFLLGEQPDSLYDYHSNTNLNFVIELVIC